MKLNPDLVRARCTEVEESVSRLERFRSLSREQFLADQDTLDLACYRLLVAIERLCRESARWDAQFEEQVGTWAILDGYYVPTRYPNSIPDSIPARVYTRDAAREAVRLADGIVTFVRARLADLPES